LRACLLSFCGLGAQLLFSLGTQGMKFAEAFRFILRALARSSGTTAFILNARLTLLLGLHAGALIGAMTRFEFFGVSALLLRSLTLCFDRQPQFCFSLGVHTRPLLKLRTHGVEFCLPLFLFRSLPARGV